MDVRNILVLLVLVDAIYSRPALVGHPYQDVSVVLEGLDFDNDGIISSGEMYQYYKSLDINNDGTVTYEEFAKSSDQNDNQQMFAYFDVLDGRRDNRISRRKIAAALQQLYDLNYDGSITTSEIDIVRKSQSTLSPEQQALLQSLQAVFNRVDTNGDGRIVVDEQLAYFDNLDLNKDGKLDYREFLASRVDSGPAPSQVILNATFTYYDTVAGKVPADGFLSRNDVRDLFQLLDLDGNGEASLVEFDTAFIKVGEAIAALINAKTTPRS